MDSEYSINQFHTQLLNLVNNCGLSIGCAYFVMKDVFRSLEDGYKQYKDIEPQIVQTTNIINLNEQETSE